MRISESFRPPPADVGKTAEVGYWPHGRGRALPAPSGAGSEGIAPEIAPVRVLGLPFRVVSLVSRHPMILPAAFGATRQGDIVS